MKKAATGGSSESSPASGFEAKGGEEVPVRCHVRFKYREPGPCGMAVRAWIGHYMGNPREWFIVFGETVDEALHYVDCAWAEPDRRSLKPIRHVAAMNFKTELASDGEFEYVEKTAHPDELSLGEGEGWDDLSEWIKLRMKEPLGDPTERDVSFVAGQLGVEDASTLRLYLPPESVERDQRPIWGWKKAELPEGWIDPLDLDVHAHTKLSPAGSDPAERVADVRFVGTREIDGARNEVVRIEGYEVREPYYGNEDRPLDEAISESLDHVDPALGVLDRAIRAHFEDIPMEGDIDSFVYIRSFVVAEAYRRRGIGSLTLDRVLEYYNRAGTYPSHVFVSRVADPTLPIGEERSEEDEGLLRFFARLGFDPIHDTPFMVLATAYNRPRPGREDDDDADPDEPDDE